MTRFAVAHIYEEYDGDHTNKVAERIEKDVLSFFSANLSSAPKVSTPPSTRH